MNLLIKHHGCWKSSRIYGAAEEQRLRAEGSPPALLCEQKEHRTLAVVAKQSPDSLDIWGATILRGRMRRHSTDLQMGKLKPTVPVVHKIVVLFAFLASIKKSEMKVLSSLEANTSTWTASQSYQS